MKTKENKTHFRGFLSVFRASVCLCVHVRYQWQSWKNHFQFYIVNALVSVYLNFIPKALPFKNNTSYDTIELIDVSPHLSPSLVCLFVCLFWLLFL